MNNDNKELPTDAEKLARAYVKTLPAINYKSAFDFGMQNIAAFKAGYQSAKSIIDHKEKELEQERKSATLIIEDYDKQLFQKDKEMAEWIDQVELVRGHYQHSLGVIVEKDNRIKELEAKLREYELKEISNSSCDHCGCSN